MNPKTLTDLKAAITEVETFAQACPHPQHVAAKLATLDGVSEAAWGMAAAGQCTAQDAAEIDNRLRALKGTKTPRTTLPARTTTAARILASLQWDGVRRLHDPSLLATLAGAVTASEESAGMLRNFMITACERVATPGIKEGTPPLYVIGEGEAAPNWVRALCAPFGTPNATSPRSLQPGRATPPVVLFEGQGNNLGIVTAAADGPGTSGVAVGDAPIARAWLPAVCGRRGYEGCPAFLVTARADLAQLRGLAGQLWAEAQAEAAATPETSQAGEAQ